MKTWFITGTDTGAGKTVFAALLARHLHRRGLRVAALKPVCSGGRADAEKLFEALEESLPLDTINPWHFRAAIAPVLAARREQRTVVKKNLLAHIRQTGKNADVVLVEGAGGLLSPLGVKVDSRDLIVALRAWPIIVAPNKLGVVNSILLTLAALPPGARAKARVVLMSPEVPDTATGSNRTLLAEFFPVERVLTLPWLGKEFSIAEAARRTAVKKVLEQF